MSDNKQTEMQKLIEQAAADQCLAQGELVRLRAVDRQDLGRLATLLAECPFPQEPLPWTRQRLEKKYDDEKKPGLWDEKGRFYLGVLADGSVAGFVEARWRKPAYEIWFHVAVGLRHRDRIGADMLGAYLQMLVEWEDPPRVEAHILGCEGFEANWLRDLGFELEVTLPEAFMYFGKPQDRQIWGWLAPRLQGGR